MSPLNRESFAGRMEQLESEQDRSEFEMGRDGQTRSRKESGLP